MKAHTLHKKIEPKESFALINIQTFWDKTAISLSLLCTLHCLALPFLLIAFPSVAALQLDNEVFHFWMVLAVLPTSIYALTLGCKKHKRRQFLMTGLFGLTFLLSAVLLPESLLGEMGEKALTLIGAALIAFSHVNNYRLCQRNKKCVCPESSKPKNV